MGPASSLLEWLLALVAVVCAASIGVLIWRCRTRQFMPTRTNLGGAVLAGVGLVVAAQVAAVGAVAVGVNRSLGIYLDWRSLSAGLSDPGGLAGDLGVGADKDTVPVTADEEAQVRHDGWYPMPEQPATGSGSYRVYPVTGSRTGIKQDVVVWIPAGVEDSEFSRLPVVMTLSGAYGAPRGFLKKARIAEQATALIAAHRVPRFIAVIPMVNVDLPHDTECVDYPAGIQAFTWLADDVRTWAHERLKVSLARSRWTVQGISLGGYCAAKLHTLRPDAFSAGASVLGYFEPIPDGTTLNLGSLLRTDQDLRRRSSVAWLVRHHTPPGRLRLLAVSSPSDGQSYPEFTRFQQAVRGVRGITFTSVPDMSHSNQSMSALQDRVLPFLLNGEPSAVQGRP